MLRLCTSARRYLYCLSLYATMSIPQDWRKVNLPGKRLSREFYARETLRVARELLGKRLVRVWQGERLAGRIVEVEAYVGPDDQASHAHYGKTARNAPMFGPPGHAYVYLIYGVHHCLNLVTEAHDFPAAILIRALEPLEGLETQHRLRNTQQTALLARGPGRLCQALHIDRRLDALDTCARDAPLWVEEDPDYIPGAIAASARVGVRGDAAALQAPWRFFVYGSPWLSGPRTLNQTPAKIIHAQQNTR